MNPAPLIGLLQRAPGVFGTLLDGLDEDSMRWRPAADKWSALEVVCHLADEEREDFRARLRSVLEDPSRDLPLSDPEAWVRDRQYLEEDFATRLDAFLDERAASVRWLKGLTDPAWENAYLRHRMRRKFSRQEDPELRRELLALLETPTQG